MSKKCPDSYLNVEIETSDLCQSQYGVTYNIAPIDFGVRGELISSYFRGLSTRDKPLILKFPCNSLFLIRNACSLLENASDEAKPLSRQQKASLARINELTLCYKRSRDREGEGIFMLLIYVTFQYWLINLFYLSILGNEYDKTVMIEKKKKLEHMLFYHRLKIRNMKESDKMVGTVVLKRFPRCEFPETLFVGKVVRHLYDGSLFRVVYDDTDYEDMFLNEVKEHAWDEAKPLSRQQKSSLAKINTFSEVKKYLKLITYNTDHDSYINRSTT
jgi:hypothetical protein